MNIWQIIDRLNNEAEFTYNELKAINETYCDTWTRKSNFEEVVGRRIDDNSVLVTCEASGWIFPVYQSDTGVGHNDGEYFCRTYMNNASHSGYEYAYDHRGNEGWCDEAQVSWVEEEERWITSEFHSRSYYRCAHCGELYHEDSIESVYSEHTDESYCSSDCCSAAGGYDSDDDVDPIHSYGTRIEHILPMNLDHGKRYFGLELEQEFPGERPSSRTAWAFDNISGLECMSIWKSDGSLSNGAELVTLPKPLSYWQKPNPVQDLCDNRDWRRLARAHDTSTCGLHVHVSRSSIPEPVIAKIIYLMNEPCMREITALVARRAPTTTYCQAAKKRWHSDLNCTPEEFYDYNKRENVKVHPWNRARPAHNVQKRQMGQGGRYTPVNLTQHTIEFRIFRGTLKWTTIQASIEFCEAVITYCTLMGPAKLNDTDFTAWLKSSVTRKTYPALRDYLESRTVLPTRRKKPADIVTAVTLSEPEIEPEAVEAPPTMYGTIEPTPEGHETNNEWSNARFGASFHEDGDHWWVGHIDVDCRGWTDDLPIITVGGRNIRVPLHCGQTWFSPDRRSSLTVRESN